VCIGSLVQLLVYRYCSVIGYLVNEHFRFTFSSKDVQCNFNLCHKTIVRDHVRCQRALYINLTPRITGAVDLITSLQKLAEDARDMLYSFHNA